MDQKIRLWRKRSSEKTIVAKMEEVQPFTFSKKLELKNSLKSLHEKSASAIGECSEKYGLMQSSEKMGNVAIADKKRAEEDVRRLKEALDEVVQQRVSPNDRLSHFSLKDCMEQQVRDEQEQIALDAMMEKTKELEKGQRKLEDKQSTASENSYLTKALLVKEKMIDDLNNIKSRTEAEFEGLMARLESSEKETAFLRYELGVLQKELELRNEEVEYSRRSAEAAHKRHLEDVKKIERLDADCQRLRGLMRTKLLCESDVEVQGRNFIDCRRNSSTETPVYQEAQTFDSAALSPVPVERSWTTSLVGGEKHPQAELECKMIEASDMGNFVEMEKLAIIGIDVPFSASDLSRTFSNFSKETNLATKELVLVQNTSSQKPSAWLQDVANVISEQIKISKRSVDELLGDIRMALQGTVHRKFLISSLSSNLNLSTCDGFSQHIAANGAMELSHKLQQSQDIVASLKNELEILKESRTIDDEMENLKAINEDLDTQLTVTRSKLNELRQKLSRAEVELDNKNQCCEELEETCVELLLQLESMNKNKYSQDHGGQEELLRSGLAITRSSSKHAEFEETILKQGKQLNALGPSKELFMVNKALSINGAKTKKLKQQRSSLRDQLLSETNVEAIRNKQLVCTTGANDSSITRASRHNILSFPECRVAATDKFLTMKSEPENAKAGALVLVPGKRGGGMGFLAKLLLRRKKASSTKAPSW